MIKKALFSLICVCWALYAQAYDFMYGDLYYNITSSTNMTVEVTYNSRDKYSGSSYVIPEWVS